MSINKNSTRRLVTSLDKKESAEDNIYLLAGLGGHVMSLQLLARELSAELKAYGLLHPVFLGNDADTIEAVAASMCEELLHVYDKRPLYIAGFSMGGLIAIEMARLLKSWGIPVHVILVDTSMPILPPKKPLILRFHIHMRWHIERFFAGLTKGFYSDHKKKLVAVNEGDSMQPKMPERFQKAFDLGRQAIQSYTIRPCSVNAVLICSENLPWWDNLRRWPEDRGWSDYINLVDIQTCPGDHLDLLTNPHCRKKTGQAIVNAVKMLKNVVETAL